MTELDQELRPLALELIQEFGKPIVVAISAIGVYNQETRTNSVIAVEVATKALEEDFKLGHASEADLVEIGDKKLTVAAIAFASKPTSQDKIWFTVSPGEKWTVINVIEVMSGELAALYELQVRFG